MAYVKRDAGGFISSATSRPNPLNSEFLAEDDPDLVAFMTRDESKPWPEVLSWAPADHDRFDDDRRLRRGETARDAIVVLIELIDQLLADATIAATDFTPETRARYQALKVIADRFRS